MFTGNQAKDKLKSLGWSYRAVAPVLGVGFVHLCLVLNGHRRSERLLQRIQDLEISRDFNVAHPFPAEK